MIEDPSNPPPAPRIPKQIALSIVALLEPSKLIGGESRLEVLAVIGVENEMVVLSAMHALRRWADNQIQAAARQGLVAKE